MQNNRLAIGMALVAMVIAIVALAAVFVVKSSPTVGGGTRFPNGISADSTSPSAGQIRGATLTTTGDVVIGGGDDGLIVTSANTATSSIEVGCWQSYATSTATALKLMFTASTTAPTNGSGIIPVVSYGTCP
jgi:hypothetical protein